MYKTIQIRTIEEATQLKLPKQSHTHLFMCVSPTLLIN